MPKKNLSYIKFFLKIIPLITIAGVIIFPVIGYTTQLHSGPEGIITHQIGHFFFLFSMVTLIFTVTGKGLNKQKGWRLIQWAAFFFILWNLCAITTHFFDNQVHAVKIDNLSIGKIKITANNNSLMLTWFYYFLKLDHLLCVPAMLFLYKGLSNLVDAQQRRMMETKDTQ